MTEQQFIEALRAQGIELTQHQISQFRTYFEMLVEWNEKINLTAVTGEEEVYLKHFYDSLTPLFNIDIKQDADICDVGAGAGFPSIPMKIVRPDLNVSYYVLLNKRIGFLIKLSVNLYLKRYTL